MSYDVIARDGQVLEARFPYPDAIAQRAWLRRCGIDATVVPHNRKAKASSRTCS